MLSFTTNLIHLDVLLVFIFLYLVLHAITAFLRRDSQHRVPPGPKPLPLVGNLFDLPKSHDWLEWTKYKASYGPLSSISVLGMRMVFLNEPQLAIDLLDKKSSIYSDRPCPEFFGKVVGWQHALAFVNYGPQFREHRRKLHQTMGTRAAIEQLHPLLVLESRRLLWRLAFKPQSLLKQIRLTAGAIILSISHGYTVDQLGSEPDPLVKLADETVHSISTAGIWLLDLLPFLRYLPEWVPGMNFTEKAKPFRTLLDDLVEKPHSFVKRQMALGKAIPSFTSTQLEQSSGLADDFTIKWSAMTLYSAGADTVVSALHSFFLALTLYPHVQRRAQEEIDRVIGNDRLPTMADRERLLYVDAVVKEVYRWKPATPLGLPHVVSEDDVYMDHHIPKGSVIFANIWEFTHNADTYSEPLDFKPERYLAENGSVPEKDPRAHAFGFGRRICPGKELAEASLFTEIAMILATFSVAKAKDANGNTTEPCTEVTSGVVCHPVEFECNITPRSARALELIRSVEDEMPFQESDQGALSAIQGGGSRL